jgi:hypothetical protein
LRLCKLEQPSQGCCDSLFSLLYPIQPAKSGLPAVSLSPCSSVVSRSIPMTGSTPELSSQGCCESLFSLSSILYSQPSQGCQGCQGCLLESLSSCSCVVPRSSSLARRPSSAVRAAVSLSSLSPLSYTASQVRAVRAACCGLSPLSLLLCGPQISITGSTPELCCGRQAAGQVRAAVSVSRQAGQAGRE